MRSLDRRSALHSPSQPIQRLTFSQLSIEDPFVASWTPVPSTRTWPYIAGTRAVDSLPKCRGIAGAAAREALDRAVHDAEQERVACTHDGPCGKDRGKSRGTPAHEQLARGAALTLLDGDQVKHQLFRRIPLQTTRVNLRAKETGPAGIT